MTDLINFNLGLFFIFFPSTLYSDAGFDERWHEINDLFVNTRTKYVKMFIG